MISTKNIISSLSDVPAEWPFEYYLQLKEKLTGQDIKILSAFNAKDKIPSMFIYMDSRNMIYKFKDFSSGYQGDNVQLVMLLFNLPERRHAAGKIINDYQEYVLNHNPQPKAEFKFHDKFKVVDYEMRHWTNQDSTFWTSFKIGSTLLSTYNVAPLAYFTMEKKEEDSSVTSFTFNRPFLYGYFREDGELYKIYMPKNVNKKFIKVQNYVQGIDQLKYDCKYLIITSSLKDLLCFKKLGIGNVECIAPDSENTMIGESVINKLIPQYTKIIVLFDNDEPGIKAAQRYKEKYGFEYVVLDMSKDLSDSVKDHGIEAVRDRLLPLLKQAL
jgi:hypothetical protein